MDILPGTVAPLNLYCIVFVVIRNQFVLKANCLQIYLIRPFSPSKWESSTGMVQGKGREWADSAESYSLQRFEKRDL